MSVNTASDTNAPWSDNDTKNVIRGIISLVLNSRPEIYSIPALQPVSNNGGDRINKKIQQILKKMEEAYKVDGIVAEEVAKCGRGKRSPQKMKKGEGVGESPGKKRKVKAGTEEGEMEELE